MSNMQTDVLIIGAGPTGLALANQLSRHGVRYEIVEKREGTTSFSKAIGVQARTLEIYDQLGIADQLIDQGLHSDRVRLVGGGKVRGEIDLTNIGAGLSPFPFLLIVEQGLHETLLYEHLKASGGEVKWLTDVEEFSQHENGVTATIVKNGVKESIEANYLVGCDGSHSLVRRKLGLHFEGSTFERLFYVADVEIEWEFPHDALHVNLGEDTLTAFFPMVGENRWRVVGTFPEGHEADPSTIDFDEIERKVKEDTSISFEISNVNWHSVYKVHSRAVEKFSLGRCFLAGDSAHIHTPAGGQGMNTGIQDGYNLAWKLAEVLKHGASESLLDTYNEERLPNARKLLRTTDRAFDFAASDDWLVSFFRNNIFPYIAGFALSIDAVKHIAFPLISQIGISYRESSLSVTSGKFNVKAGDRMPWFEIDGTSIYDRFREPKYHVAIFSDSAVDLENNWGDRVNVHRFPLSDAAKTAFGHDAPFVVILRPDNYIGLLSDDVSISKIDRYLNR